MAFLCQFVVLEVADIQQAAINCRSELEAYRTISVEHLAFSQHQSAGALCVHVLRLSLNQQPIRGIICLPCMANSISFTIPYHTIPFPYEYEYGYVGD